MTDRSFNIAGPDRTEPLPNFFIIGAPKCATSAMHAYLAEHPQVFMSHIKEPHYFSDDLIMRSQRRSLPDYLALFEDAGDALIAGESSVFYMLSEKAAENIHRYQPGAKLLVMLRDPAEVVASHHNQILYEGHETEKDLRRALALEEERREKHGEGPYRIADRVLHYSDMVRFHQQIERYLKLFPREQMHVVFYEDVLADLPGVYRGILEFLGVDPDFRPEFPVQNARKEMRSRKVDGFLRNTPDWVTRLARVVLPGRLLRRKILWKLRLANTRFIDREPVSADIRHSIMTAIKSDVEALSALLHRDLQHWFRKNEG